VPKKDLNGLKEKRRGKAVNPVEGKDAVLVIRDGDKPLELHRRIIHGIEVYTDYENQESHKHADRVRHGQHGQKEHKKSHRR
jgi:hypothetical protein